jgi:serine/threonine protein kinase
MTRAHAIGTGAALSASVGTTRSCVAGACNTAQQHAPLPGLVVTTLAAPEAASNGECGVQMRMARHLIVTLSALHSMHIVHGDICPANVLYKHAQSGNKRFKLGGFGNARVYSPPDFGVPVSDLSPSVPAPAQAYSAPERWVRDDQLTDKADVFAYGVTAFHCLTGHLPHRMRDGEIQGLQQDAGRRSGVPEQVFHLLHTCMRRNAARRPSAHDVEKRFGLIMQGLNQNKSIFSKGVSAKVRPLASPLYFFADTTDPPRSDVTQMCLACMLPVGRTTGRVHVHRV